MKLIDNSFFVPCYNEFLVIYGKYIDHYNMISLYSLYSAISDQMYVELINDDD